MGIDLYFNNESLVSNHITNSSANGKKAAESIFEDIQPLRHYVPPPLYFACKTQRRRLILSYISCLFFSLAVSRSITGCCVSHIEKVARSDGGVEKHHLNQSVYIRYLTPSPYTPPISPAMSRGRVEFILLHCVFVAQK